MAGYRVFGMSGALVAVVWAGSVAAKPGTTASDWEYRKAARVEGIRACVAGATAAMRARVDIQAMCACTIDQLIVRYPVKTMMTEKYAGLSLADKDIARACMKQYAPKGWQY